MIMASERTMFPCTPLIFNVNFNYILFYAIKFHSSLCSTLITSVLLTSLLYFTVFSYVVSFFHLSPLYRLFVLPPNRQMAGLRLPSPSAVTMVQRHLEIKEFHMSQIGSNPIKVRVQYCHMRILSHPLKVLGCFTASQDFLPGPSVLIVFH